ncbi:MAG TPA: DsbA family protein, partial [Kofleriaceae bacterium]
MVAALPLVFAVIADSHHDQPALVQKQQGSGSAAPVVPEVIAREQKPGVATIVDFVDFECPFCRRFAPTLDAAIASATVPVRLVRKMTPLKIHPHAMTAALAWCCADAQGKGDAMAKALFEAPVDKLTPEGCEQIAVDVGC